MNSKFYLAKHSTMAVLNWVKFSYVGVPESIPNSVTVMQMAFATIVTVSKGVLLYM